MKLNTPRNGSTSKSVNVGGSAAAATAADIAASKKASRMQRLSAGLTAQQADLQAAAAAALYPSYGRIALHTATHLLRLSFLCSLACVVLQPAFEALFDYLAVSDKVFFVVVACTAYNAVAITYQLFFAGLCDGCGYFQQYRLTRPAHLKNPPGLVWQCFRRVGFYHLLSLPFMLAMWEVSGAYPPVRSAAADGGASSPAPGALPSLWVLMPHYAYAVAWDFEAMGFLIHWAQHRYGRFYVWTHKLHHQFYETVPMAAEYVSFVEIIVGSIGNYCAFQGLPMVCYVVYVMWRISQTYEVHSGYAFRGTLLSRLGLLNAHRSEFHDFHHTHPTGSFGEHLFMDYLCRTCDGYVAHLHALGRKPLD